MGGIMGGVPYIGGPVGAIGQASALKLPLNAVRDYGADPTGTNDSTTAFSNFTTAVGADGVGVIKSPRGRLIPPASAVGSAARSLHICGTI
jgi:hypothetical protein